MAVSTPDTTFDIDSLQLSEELVLAGFHKLYDSMLRLSTPDDKSLLTSGIQNYLEIVGDIAYSLPPATTGLLLPNENELPFPGTVYSYGVKFKSPEQLYATYTAIYPLAGPYLDIWAEFSPSSKFIPMVVNTRRIAEKLSKELLHPILEEASQISYADGLHIINQDTVDRLKYRKGFNRYLIINPHNRVSREFITPKTILRYP